MTASAAAEREKAGFRLQPKLKLAPLDVGHAREELADIAAAAKEDELSRLAAFLAGKGDVQDFLAAVFDLSPFLRDVARRRPQILDALFDETVEQRLAAVAEMMGTASRSENVSEQSLMMELRLLKAEAHFLIALAELAAIPGLPESWLRLVDARLASGKTEDWSRRIETPSPGA